MNLLTKLWQSSAMAMFFILKISVAQASANALPIFSASLNQENQHPVLYSVMQFGMPGNQKFVFCRSQDCPFRSVKHIAMEEKSFLPPLIMPEPTKVDPAERAVPETEPALQSMDSKKIGTPRRKMIKKRSIKCEPEK